VRNGLADHWIEILGLDVWQVNESCGVGRPQKDCGRETAISLFDF
jgi:hypothetical protein